MGTMNDDGAKSVSGLENWDGREPRIEKKRIKFARSVDADAGRRLLSLRWRNVQRKTPFIKLSKN